MCFICSVNIDDLACSENSTRIKRMKLSILTTLRAQNSSKQFQQDLINRKKGFK